MKSLRVSLVAVAGLGLAAPASAESGRFPDLSSQKPPGPGSAPTSSFPSPSGTSTAPKVAPTAAPVEVAPAGPTTPVQTAPAPAQPPIVPSAAASPLGFAPPLLPYRDGVPIPSGYHAEKRRWSGLVWGGLATFGAAYVYAFASAAANGFGNGEGWLILPIIGPWVALTGRRSPCNIVDIPDIEKGKREVQKCVDDVQREGIRLTLIAFDGVMQLMGGGLLVAGLVTSESQLVRNDVQVARGGVRLSVGPRSVGRNGYGVGVTGIF